MVKTKLTEKTEIKVTGIVGFLEKTVTPFGYGTKVGCLKKCIGKRDYLIICKK